MGEKIPKKNMPNFDVTKEQSDELRTVSAVTKVLADNPELLKEIANVFWQIEMEKQRELVERVSKLLSEKVKDVPIEQIQASFNWWYMALQPLWHTTPRWHTISSQRPFSAFWWPSVEWHT